MITMTKFSMDLILLMVFVVMNYGFFINGISAERPDVVNIGAVFSFNSTIGKVAKIAIEAAVKDVNLDPTVLGGTKLKLTMQDTNHSNFLGIIEVLQFMESETMAIIGPQSSVTAHVISHISNELQVPLLSFAATDPTLSLRQFPFFVRTTQSDQYQMAAIADIVNYNGWREVIAIYVDDDHGRNAVAALGDNLAKKQCKISYKAPMSPKMSREDITDVLVKVESLESRILVLHSYASWGLKVFEVANYLGMMDTGFVWIATDWLSTVIDTESPLPSDAMNNIQGVLTLRMYVPDSKRKQKFVAKWNNLTGGRTANPPFSLNTYGLYAYDTVWLLAHAIDAFFTEGGEMSFSNDSSLTRLSGPSMRFDTMNIFNGGSSLLRNILQVNNLTGLTGPIKFSLDGSLLYPAYEVINVIGTGFRKIGYWSNYSGLSVAVPETLYSKPPNHLNSSQELYGVIWPGQTTQRPRGWVFPNNGRHLRIGVFNRVSYREFVSYVEASDMFTGYCIDVFIAALNQLPYAVPYKLIPFGDGINNPSGNEIVNLVATEVFDAAVGDIAITTNRTRMVDFTQPYIESGLVVVVSVNQLSSNAWAFLRPFTPMMWCVTGISFLIVGAVIWILEHRTNDDFQGPPRKQVVTILWFSFSTLFFAHRQKTVSSLGRMVLLIWLFVVLILNSNYTANLTSILTVEQLSSPIKGIDSLIASNDPIGYPHGSFAENYLADELNIHKSRLIPFNTPEEYARALKDGPQRGGVSAVVDERAYIELFLSSRCDFSIVGREFTKNGWGFAFPRGSSLAVDMSTAILKLSEHGDLQRIHDKWLMRSSCSSQEAKNGVHRLPLKSFWGLYVVCGLACLLALILYFIRVIFHVTTVFPEESESTDRTTRSSCLQRFFSLC